MYSKTCVKQPLSKIPKIVFQGQLSLNAGQKYCRMLQGEHSAILSTFIKIPFVIKIFVLSIFDWLYTGFTVHAKLSSGYRLPIFIVFHTFMLQTGMTHQHELYAEMQVYLSYHQILWQVPFSNVEPMMMKNDNVRYFKNEIVTLWFTM